MTLKMQYRLWVWVLQAVFYLLVAAYSRSESGGVVTVDALTIDKLYENGLALTAMLTNDLASLDNRNK